MPIDAPRPLVKLFPFPQRGCFRIFWFPPGYITSFGTPLDVNFVSLIGLLCRRGSFFSLPLGDISSVAARRSAFFFYRSCAVLLLLIDPFGIDIAADSGLADYVVGWQERGLREPYFFFCFPVLWPLSFALCDPQLEEQ